MTMETFDVLDCRGIKTGEIISRNDAHISGTWHGAFHCMIIHEREGKAYALFQKRSADKKIAPGKFYVSAGGHYSAGENAVTAGPREIREELGLNVKFEELLPLGRRVFVYCFTPGVREYEFQDVFFLPKKISLGEWALQEEEVDGLLDMEVASGLRLFNGEAGSIESDFYKRDNAVERRKITVADFVPCLDNYYLKLLILAHRYFQGERKLLFI